MRVSADEMAEEGLHVDETLDICDALDASGLVDYINVIGGYSASASGWLHVFPSMAVPPGYWTPQAAAIRQRMSRRPVLVGGRINQPQLAEEVVAEGQADMVGMVRALICDPDLPVKAENGAGTTTSAPVSAATRPVSDTGYPIIRYRAFSIRRPAARREFAHDKSLAPVSRKKVLVIGGGPGGMKAAAIAAERGHDVTLGRERRPARRSGAARADAAGARRIRRHHHQFRTRNGDCRRQGRTQPARPMRLLWASTRT